jgi:hypothetical protein
MADVYKFELHNLVKAMGRNHIVFPISKNELLERIGGVDIQTDFDKKTPLNKIIELFDFEEFESAAIFYQCYTAIAFGRAIGRYSV